MLSSSYPINKSQYISVINNYWSADKYINCCNKRLLSFSANSKFSKVLGILSLWLWNKVNKCLSQLQVICDIIISFVCLHSSLFPSTGKIGVTIKLQINSIYYYKILWMTFIYHMIHWTKRQVNESCFCENNMKHIEVACIRLATVSYVSIKISLSNKWTTSAKI